ncbi:DNA polymerase III subunit chi [Pseudomonas sp. UL073]|uniref:DNA polymerase III subunit chi n=1 Tax=Zestomonas insulae TaxID=2809017 RepID=A0ABS2ICV1_9GAMM|nr:DNA polymerase III subunit chi [Pseudomonas insulae]MBM7059993.1 DNA polymerase III subunit chi [Pseudomonas insulae]
MDTPKPPIKPTHLLDDLESIRQLLDEEGLEPPLLTETIDSDAIPLLSEIIPEAPAVTPAPTQPALPLEPAPAPPVLERRDPLHLDKELRAAAQLLLQDVIDDFVPQIEAELKRRLEARMERLLSQRKR